MTVAMPDINKIMAFEDGQLSPDETVEFFGELVASGAAWTLQGMYGRAAASLIQQGFIDRAGKVLRLPSEGE